MFLVSGKDEAGWLGTAANLLLGMAMVLAAAFVYLRQRTRRGALLGLAAGVAAGTAVMAAANYWFFLPTYGIPREALGSTLKVVVLFNLVKGTLSSTLTFLLYKRVRPLLSSG
ncbi:MAG TPA: ECF transporter S component [Firmicutes bacterium]|nr:ECF transporter S component [Bacillota bacterium]